MEIQWPIHLQICPTIEPYYHYTSRQIVAKVRSINVIKLIGALSVLKLH